MKSKATKEQSFFKRNWLVLFLFLMLIAAFGFGLYLIFLYHAQFPGAFPLTPSDSGNPGDTRGQWGTMGDFFGGMLNPLFSLLGLVMLLVTLIQNQRELEFSRQELRESKEALEAQAATFDKQRFEDTFFALLEQLNNALDKVAAETHQADVHGKGEIKSITREIHGKIFDPLTAREENSLKRAKHKLLGHSPSLNQYFRLLYQVLKFIADRCPQTFPDQGMTSPMHEDNIPTASEKFYSNIVRSCIPEDVSHLVAVNCSVDGPADAFVRYKTLVERYEFLEHMTFQRHGISNHLLLDEIVLHFKKSAFGANSDYPNVRERAIQTKSEQVLTPIDGITGISSSKGRE